MATEPNPPYESKCGEMQERMFAFKSQLRFCTQTENMSLPARPTTSALRMPFGPPRATLFIP